MKEVLLQESNELEGHQAVGLPQPGCSSAGLALGPGPPSSSTNVQAFPSLFSEPIKEEVNEAWGGNYTNANRQMSHIVLSYNKQYGCLWYICIRKGGALRKPCFDCISPRARYFFPPVLQLFFFFFFRVTPVAFLCNFCVTRARELCVDLGILEAPSAFIFPSCAVDNVLVSHSEPSQNMCHV